MIIDRNAVTQEVPIDPETGKPYHHRGRHSGVGQWWAPVSLIRGSGRQYPRNWPAVKSNALFTNVWKAASDDVLAVAGDAAAEARRARPPGTSLVLHMDISPRFHRPADRKSPSWWMRSSPTSRRSSKASLPPARACFVITRFMGR